MMRMYFAALAVSGLVVGGCSKAPDPVSTSAPYAASEGGGDTSGLPAMPADPVLSDPIVDATDPDSIAKTSDRAPIEEAANMAAMSGIGAVSNQPSERDPSPGEPARPIADNEIPVPPAGIPIDDGSMVTGQMPERPLKANLTPDELVAFLAGADRDMQIIASGRSGIDDPEQARSMLVQIIKMKLEASRRLASSTTATKQMASEGARGELQALSHLAALGDLKAATELESLAATTVQSSDPLLASDSRLVLIGFAIERLQQGDGGAAGRIVELVDALAKSSASGDVPAMMVMGEARDKLARYGHDAEAKRVRDTIIDVFADSPDAAIAQMAAQVAGNVRFDGIEGMRATIVDGGEVPMDQWQEAVETLIDESADLQTVQYLAGAALEFEAAGFSDPMTTTYDVLERRFNDDQSATGREVALAVRAKQARQRVLGRPFDPDLPSVDGPRIRIQDFKGKVVLMPFWATSFPESLQIMPMLKEIEANHPDDVAILGMNLDAGGETLDVFLKENPLGFPSFRAESSATEKVANPVAAQFGLVSMPFVAILDREGRVAALDFTGQRLAETVNGLIKVTK
ncbi:thiol-disulfide oxidoreductase [Rubripirellula tenax]|uniref:Thiol-disulfide oxidoreductase n=1 Tax=Rubripirellula tenax TaxID=2528015 RepID=A0A5C6EGF3_9BACT|nr:TlpA disulfide reductase family protein [Rubripirellula tenax]TWU47544.1 thiol-disulfide oxidoreductase [Rubripirellula tenax]